MLHVFFLSTTQSLLLSAQAVGGFFALLFLFAFCFFGVHILRYAKIGWELQEKPSAEPPKTEEKPEEKAPASPPSQEPVYYIVEKKQRRAKPRYSEPKEIRFK